MRSIVNIVGSELGDAGEPLMVARPDSVQAVAFRGIAGSIQRAIRD